MASALFQNPIDMTDDEWERRIAVMKDMFERLENIRELTESLEYSLDYNDSFAVGDLLILHDRLNALVAVALAEGIVTDTSDKLITYEDWDRFTLPAVAQDEVVLSANEFDREVDLAYSDGVADAWEDAESAGIDMGIILAARVFRVLGAVIASPEDLRVD